jgi:hypothetical protein
LRLNFAMATPHRIRPIGSSGNSENPLLEIIFSMIPSRLMGNSPGRSRLAKSTTKGGNSRFLLLILVTIGLTIPTLGQADENCSTCQVEEKKGTSPAQGKKSSGFSTFNAASAKGKRLWNDSTLGTTGFTCLSGGCHSDFSNLGFDNNQLYPHYVEMAEKVVTLTQMINYCLINPMAGKALEADSDKMTAMASFYRSYRIKYRSEKERKPTH